MSKIDVTDLGRNKIPSIKMTKEERLKNVKLLEEVKKNSSKVVRLSKGFSYTGFKKKVV